MAPALDNIIPSVAGGLSLSKVQLLGFIAAVGTLSYLGLLVYRLFFHPLAKYPGPRLYAVTHAPYVYKNMVTGDLIHDMTGLHKRYGPIVRIAPNRLSIDGGIAFPEIFQYRTGKPEWPKVQNYYFQGDKHSIIAGDQETHRRLRKQLSHAFSEASLFEQEPVVMKYVDLLCSRMGEKAATGEAFDVVRWCNFTTFDIIGDLMFADSFHSLDGSDYHPWVRTIFNGVRGASLLRALVQYPFLGPLLKNFGKPAKLIAAQSENQELAGQRALARKEQGEAPGGRKDFMTYMLRKNRDGTPGYSDMDVDMNSHLLVTAGSETTATSLSAFFLHLGMDQHRHVYNKLTAEIRGAFTSEAEIDMRSTAKLPYLCAVIEENLRLFPPAGETPPRISPGAVVNGEFIPKGTVITVFQLSTYRNPANFADPDSFRPERWLLATHPLYDPMFAKDNHDSFRPFSFGTRNCIGKNFAYSELRVLISRLLYRFDFTLEPGQEDWISRGRAFVIWDKPEIRVKFQERSSKTDMEVGKLINGL